MSTISLSRGHCNTDVLVSSGFLTKYMPSANGEYVKIYLYLLQALQLGGALSTSAMADIFEMPEKDVIRALKYWDSKGVLALTYEGKAISHITLLSPWEQSAAAVQGTAVTLEKLPEKNEQPAVQEKTASIPPQDTSAQTSPRQAASAKASSVQEPVAAFALTPAMIQTAENSESFRNLLNLVQFYFKLTINSIDYEKLIWIYFQLGQDFDACEVLVEYCADKPKKGNRMRQLEQLACSCIEQELFSAKAIRAHLMHTDHCRLVKDALGVSKKVLATTEQEFVRKWFEDLGFDEALVKEACARAVRNTETGRFEYTDKILSSWHQEKIHSLEQVAEQDARFQESRRSYPPKSSSSKSRPASNKFNNFEQRDTDFSEMEALVFGYTE